MKITCRWAFSIGQKGFALKVLSLLGLFWRMSQHSQKGRSSDVLLPHSPTVAMPAFRGAHSPALPGCCWLELTKDQAARNRKSIVARFPCPLLRMARSAISEGHFKGRLWQQNCPWNVSGVPECLNSWKCVRELPEEIMSLFLGMFTHSCGA